MLFRFKKRFLIVMLFALFLFLTACACFDSDEKGEDYTYELSGDEYQLVTQLMEDANIQRDTVEALAKAADQSKVFDKSGTTGWEALMDDIDDGMYEFEKDFEAEEVFGVYTEDMTGDLSGGECAYTHELCSDYFIVNLDLLSLGNIGTSCPPHEGIHDVGFSHSSTLNDLLATLGGEYVDESSFWKQVVSDQDVPYDASFFYFVTDDTYDDYLYDCGAQIDGALRRIGLGQSSAEEEEAWLREEYVDKGCDKVLEDAALNTYNSFEVGFDFFGITQEEFEDALTNEFCPEVTTVCQEIIGETDFNVEPTNIAPTAVISVGEPETYDGDTYIFLNGTGSTDSDGSIVGYIWNMPGSATYTTVYTSTAVPLYTTPGTYSVTLTVEDDDGATDTETVTIEVTAPSEES